MKLKHPVRFLVLFVTALVVIWMCYNFVVALQTGETFHFLGNGSSRKGAAETFVVAGVDEGGYRTDLILLCQINRQKGEVHILQIPRDTKVTNRRNDKKINSAYYSGFDVMAQEIAQITGVTPQHYAMVDFAGFRDIVDAVGGVTIEVPFDMVYEDPVQDLVIDLKEGKKKLDGAEAEMYMRYRQGSDGNGYTEGDVGRLSAQQQLYGAVADKMLSPGGILRIPAVFSAVKKNTNTDYTGGQIFGLMIDVLKAGKDNIMLHTLPGGGRYIGSGSYFVPDKAATQELMQENFVLDGE